MNCKGDWSKLAGKIIGQNMPAMNVVRNNSVVAIAGDTIEMLFLSNGLLIGLRLPLMCDVLFLP